MTTQAHIAELRDPATGARTAREPGAGERHPIGARQAVSSRPMAVRMLVSFVVTMLGLRALTFGQQTHILPVPDVAGDGIHIHHFVWGIVILGVVAFRALTTPDPASNVRLALLFGIGTGLVVDEFALWLTLRDVYFDPQGAWSVELAGAVALSLLANVVWRSRPMTAAATTSGGALLTPEVPNLDAEAAR
jgi:hypothetical protein